MPFIKLEVLSASHSCKSSSILLEKNKPTDFASPFFADRWGRKLPIFLGCLLMILGGLLGAFCNGYGMYVAGRLLLGIGNSLAQMASPILLAEIAHPQHRGKVTSIYNCLWNLGALVVAWLAWGTMQIHSDWSWRILTLLQILPAVIQLSFIWCKSCEFSSSLFSWSLTITRGPGISALAGFQGAI
jgi:MFS family permease